MESIHKILHIEDEEDILFLTDLTLSTSENLEILQFSRGQKAIDCIGDFKPDLFLLDSMMPGLDGIETLLGLHQINGLEDIPVVFMTAKSNIEECERFRSIGHHIIGVIHKPFDALGLADQLNAFWQDHLSRKNLKVA